MDLDSESVECIETLSVTSVSHIKAYFINNRIVYHGYGSPFGSDSSTNQAFIDAKGKPIQIKLFIQISIHEPLHS